jgi:hypothetical protein
VTVADLRDGSSLVYRFDADQDDAFWLARQLCEQWLRERHVRADAVGDLLLVVTELCTGATTGVVLELHLDGDGVEVIVESNAGPIVEGPVGDLRLAAALCDEIVLRVRPDRTTVRATRHGVVLPE